MKELLLEAKKLKKEAGERQEDNLKSEDKKRIFKSFSQILDAGSHEYERELEEIKKQIKKEIKRI